MKSILKQKSTQIVIILLICIFSLFYLITVAYSAFSSTMNITGIAKSRVETDVRITNFSIYEISNATSQYEEFSKNTLAASIEFKQTGTVTYKIEVTNYGAEEVGIYDITGLPEGISYEIINYNLKDKICNEYNKCNNLAVKEFYIKLSGSNTIKEFTITMDFRTFHKITYLNLTGQYPTEIMDRDSISIDLSNENPVFINVKSSETVDYVYLGSILYLNNITNDIEVESISGVNNDYDYTGNVQTFIAPITGVYKLEVWGAQGADNGGYGGYSTGEIELQKDQTLYIYVGGAGSKYSGYTPGKGGYNGGGNGGTASSSSYSSGNGGGGATHIATDSGLLSELSNSIDSILIAAGGGGGGGILWGSSGSGGGFKGTNGTTGSGSTVAAGTQSSGSSFGKGANGVKKSYADSGAEGSGGGGGGFYGGGTAGTGLGSNGGGGGGSGYIGNERLKSKYMVCYNCTTSTGTDSKTNSVNSYSQAATTDKPKSGNGYAKISLIEAKTHSSNIVITNVSYDSNVNADINNSKINNYNQTTIDSSIVLTNNSNSSIKYSVTIYNSSIKPYYFTGYEHIGNNENISIEVMSLEEGYILSPKTKTTFYITFSYKDSSTITNTTINSTITLNFKLASYIVGEYDYIGKSQKLNITESGIYKLEVWGGQGGYSGGYGGYAQGTISLKKGDSIYITVGECGKTWSSNVGGAGGYNGGGKGGNSSGSQYPAGAGGGGATHIATADGVLSTLSSNINSILIVAGGGGGNNDWGSFGHGGGFQGGNGTTAGGATISGGTQTSGYAFGKGASGVNKTTANCGAEGSGGGGGGFYGGATSGTGVNSNAGGGGGSGYVANSLLTNKYMYCYNCATSTETDLKTNTTTATSSTAKSDTPKQGNGYAIITYISE